MNCAAIPETLLESELFGTRKALLPAQMHGGSVALSRQMAAPSSSMRLATCGPTRAKLLRVLQEKTIQRLGGRDGLRIDVRVLAATHLDLEAAMREKEFREDLFFRLNVVAIEIPPLRKRPEDIPDTVRYFLARYGAELGMKEPSIHPEALRFLQQQPWRGNVRELENAVRKALLMARGYPIGLDEASRACAGSAPPGVSGESLASYAPSYSLPPAAAKLRTSTQHLSKRPSVSFYPSDSTWHKVTKPRLRVGSAFPVSPCVKTQPIRPSSRPERRAGVKIVQANPFSPPWHRLS